MGLLLVRPPTLAPAAGGSDFVRRRDARLAADVQFLATVHTYNHTGQVGQAQIEPGSQCDHAKDNQLGNDAFFVHRIISSFLALNQVVKVTQALVETVR